MNPSSIVLLYCWIHFFCFIRVYLQKSKWKIRNPYLLWHRFYLWRFIFFHRVGCGVQPTWFVLLPYILIILGLRKQSHCALSFFSSNFFQSHQTTFKSTQLDYVKMLLYNSSPTDRTAVFSILLYKYSFFFSFSHSFNTKCERHQKAFWKESRFLFM